MERPELDIRPYARNARPLIQSGDILAWTPTSLVGHAIRIAGDLTGHGGPYSHVGMAVWHSQAYARVSRPVLLDVQQLCWSGGHPTNLSREIKRFPAKCDVWRIRQETFSGPDAAQAMMRLAGSGYGWKDLIHVGHSKLLPWTKHVLPMPSEDTNLVCSEAVAWAAFLGGATLPCLIREMGPNDFCSIAEYQFTLGA